MVFKNCKTKLIWHLQSLVPYPRTKFFDPLVYLSLFVNDLNYING